MAAFLIFVLIILCFLILHPYTTYPLSLVALRSINGKKKIARAQPEPTTFAILCCAYNEAASIEAKIQNSLEIRKMLGNVDLIFYSDGSSDGTNEILLKYASSIDAVIGTERQGKTAGLNIISKRTSAEILIFTDANVSVDVNLIGGLSSNFCNADVGLVSGSLRFDRAQGSVAELSNDYRGFEEILKKLESDTGSIVYTDGTLFAIRRSIFREIPEFLTDDLFTAINVLLQRYLIISSPELIAYENAAAKRSDELRRRVRIGCHVFNCHLYLWPEIRKLDSVTLYKYLSHKLVRWFSGYFLIASYIVFSAIVLLFFGTLALFAVLTLTVLTFTVSTLFHVPLISKICDAILVMIAFGYGVYLACRGEKFRTWKVASSARKAMP
jgi:cellulose synthase/poly-beta-1,6-N-acetylglucosamine synthase-like glycosyltransferase